MAETYRCVMVEGEADRPRVGVQRVSLDDLPPGDVVMEVEFSSLNYKDALACAAHPGVVKELPHVPGIDAAGRVVESDSDAFTPGQAVLVTGYELGAPRWGGFCERVRVPADWVVAMPEGLDARSAMVYGTAGFTAAQCVAAIVDRGVEPGDGEVVVTGATGGVGTWSVALLARLGYRVVAVTGKQHLAEVLQEAGAAEVVGREAMADDPQRPLLASRYAAAVDTVGGDPLAAALKSLQHRGVVSACGLVAGEHLSLTVYPFILRGVTLAGIDSAKCPRGPRLDIWQRLAGPWRTGLPEQLVTTLSLEEVPDRVEQMRRGEVAGRTLVVPHAAQ